MQVAEYPQYGSYRDSEADWAGSLPAEWAEEKAKWLYLRAERPVQPDDEIVTCFRDGQVTLRSNRRTEGFTNALKEHGYQRIHKGDLVIHAMDAFAGAIGVSDSTGKSTPVYSACIPRKPDTVNPYFYAYYMRSLAGSGYLVSLAKGIRERSTDFRFADFAELVLALPSLDTQNAIVRFLDEKTGKIDAAIALEARQIVLLKERKQIVIQNAVTKGLNPNAPMKDSGVDWIGEIPAHWAVFPLFSKTRIKSVSNCADRDLLSVYLDLGVVKFSDVEEKRTNATSLDLSAYQAVDPGDFVLNNQQAWRGSVGVSMHKGIVSPAYIVLSLSSDFDPEFANYYFRSPALVSHYLIGSKGVGTIQRNLYWPKLRTTPISIPPIDEQIEIVEYIRTEAGKIDRAISLKNDQIAALREYKATLIDSAVTGKIKVA
ncbi:MAG: restriction endonuclease subunit S [Sphingopyxis sp.]|jgi:type I restriction enzyme S subunit|uniref:restriction endonuclease subunit S n=1 Tax=Alphaproteobacteria TaxID=28211 RepID=UPI003F71FEE7